MPFRDSLAKLAFSVFWGLTFWVLINSAAWATPQEVLAYQIGFDGKIKLGCWSPISFKLPTDCDATHFEITAPDGNGIPIAFRGPLSVNENSDRKQAFFKTGRSMGNLDIRLLDINSQPVSQLQIQLDGENVQVIDATIPICLTIESDNAIADDIRSIQTPLFGRRSEIIAIDDASPLPLTSKTYAGIHVVYLTTSNEDLVNSISTSQWAALENWIASGGKLVFCAGRNCQNVFAQSSPLSRLLPGTFNGPKLISRSSQFENYTQRGQLLGRDDEPLPSARIENPTGIVELSISDNPVVIRAPYQFGQIVFSAVDFDTEPFVSWTGQKNYLMRLTFGQLNLNRTLAGEAESRSIVQVGQNDIMGQLFFPLEDFSQVQFINFTVVAIVIAIFILCIGPGDYFLLKKLIGKMEWTWITFTLLAIGFCGLAVFMSRASKPSTIQINQLEIIDFDTTSDSIRGNIWTNIYSPSNTKCDVSAPAVNAIGCKTEDTVVAWMGLPGGGLGGMRSITSPGLTVQSYTCDFTSNKQSKLQQVPIKVSSTKPIHSEYQANKNLESNNRLRLNRTTNQLQGTITNPFDFELRDCRIVFENWAYILDRPLEPGETIDVFSEMKERTATSYFSRRVATEDSKGGDVPWNPQEDNIDRIAEFIMFYQGAGGQRYTKLTHGFQSNLDMTEQLYLNRAVLFGKAQDVCTQLNIKGDAGDIDYDQCRTYLRIVLPVSYKKR